MQGLFCVDTWKRIAAFAVDLIILYAITPFFMALFCILLRISPPTLGLTNPMMLVLGMIFLIISWLYFAFTESSKKQSTLGKRLFRLIVTDTQGNRITFRKATIRFWSKFFVFPGFSLTGLIIKNKSWHDVFAKTCVVNRYILLTGNIR
jgi:uncharacterized RDD family membrane protein YckC